MSAPLHHWFHCAKCGSIYQGNVVDSLCEGCQRSPLPPVKKSHPSNVETIKHKRKEFHAHQVAAPSTPSDEPSENKPSSISRLPTQRKETERVKKKSNFLLKFVACWVAGLLLLAAIIKFSFRQSSSTPTPESSANSKDKSEAVTMGELSKNEELLSKGIKPCYEVFVEFLQSMSPETKAAFVINNKKASVTIANDGGKTPNFAIDEQPKLLYNGVITVAGEPLIETIWEDARGRKVEAVFAKRDGEYRLDWEAYSRSSDIPWNVFKLGDEQATATFRMLVRERLAEQRVQQNFMSVVFMEPSFWHGIEGNTQTSEFLVDRSSDNGKLITAALLARQNKTHIYASYFPHEDPPGYARVRVKIERRIVNGVKSFVLKEVLAGHWLSSDDVGISIEE